jgi:prepilin-type N-terminal cleavage/methylation domain-containing protein
MRDTVSSRRRQGFTLMELMIIVTIIGLLAILAIPAIHEARRRSRDTSFINDLRNLSNNVFYQYALSHGGYPDAAAPGVLPADVAGYLRPSFDYSAETPIGGNWEWDRGATPADKVDGICYAGLSVHLPARTSAQMTRIDGMFDDGNLGSGLFRSRTDGYIYILEP